MPAIGLSFIVQIAFIVHALKNDKPYYWIFILFFMPGLGPLVYFIVELLPEILESRSGRSAVRGIKKTLNPAAELRQRQIEHRLSGSVDATRRLAGELLASGKYRDAIEHYQQALNGLYEHDPDLLLGLATAQFASDEFLEARQTLDRLIEHNPDYKSPEGHLIYARAVEACGDVEQAHEEYVAVIAYFAGAEAHVRFGSFLESQGKSDLAREQYEEILTAAELAPKHYVKAQKEWINAARTGLKRLDDHSS